MKDLKVKYNLGTRLTIRAFLTLKYLHYIHIDEIYDDMREFDNIYWQKRFKMTQEFRLSREAILSYSPHTIRSCTIVKKHPPDVLST